MMVTLAHSCLVRKTLMPGSQIVLMDYMSFHSASSVRTLCSTNLSRITLFQETTPAYSLICKDSCAVLNKTALMFLMVCLEKKYLLLYSWK